MCSVARLSCFFWSAVHLSCFLRSIFQRPSTRRDAADQVFNRLYDVDILKGIFVDTIYGIFCIGEKYLVIQKNRNQEPFIFGNPDLEVNWERPPACVWNFDVGNRVHVQQSLVPIVNSVLIALTNLLKSPVANEISQ